MRRGNGTGSIYKLSGNRRKPWVVMAPATFDDDGNAKRVPIGYYSSRTQAERALSDYISAPYDADKASKITLREVYDLWRKKYDADKAPKTVAGYQFAEAKIAPLLPLRIRDIRIAQLEELFDGFRNLSYSSRHRIKSVLNGVFDYAVRLELISKSPVDSLDIGKAKKSTLHTIFTDEEINTLWERRSELSPANILVLIFTGMRPREAIIQPITSEDKARGWFVAIGNKTETSKGRIIPIHPALREILANRDRLIERAGDNYGDSSSDSSYNLVRLACRMFGHLPHDGRHTAATLMKRYHVDEYARKRILGHAGGNITDDVYTHADADYLTAEFLKIPCPPFTTK